MGLGTSCGAWRHGPALSLKRESGHTTRCPPRATWQRQNLHPSMLHAPRHSAVRDASVGVENTHSSAGMASILTRAGLVPVSGGGGGGGRWAQREQHPVIRRHSATSGVGGDGGGASGTVRKATGVRQRCALCVVRGSGDASSSGSSGGGGGGGGGGSGGGGRDGAKLLVEVSTGGQLEQRRWARSPTGGFDRLPPARLDADADAVDAGSSPDEDPPPPWLSFDSWDPRQSPRLRAIFLPAGQGLTLAHFSAQPEPFLTQNSP